MRIIRKSIGGAASLLWEGSRRLSATDQKIALGLRRPRMLERIKGELKVQNMIQKEYVDLRGS